MPEHIRKVHFVTGLVTLPGRRGLWALCGLLVSPANQLRYTIDPRAVTCANCQRQAQKFKLWVLSTLLLFTVACGRVDPRSIPPITDAQCAQLVKNSIQFDDWPQTDSVILNGEEVFITEACWQRLSDAYNARR